MCVYEFAYCIYICIDMGALWDHTRVSCLIGPEIMQLFHDDQHARFFFDHSSGQELAECSLYGIRVYTTGAILATHVDRMPLVSSAILNVDQDCK